MAHCFGCNEGGNGIVLARKVLGLGFRDGLVWCARLTGHHALADEIQGGRDAPRVSRPPVPLPPPRPEREYPDPGEVRALLTGCVRATSGPVHDHLRSRNIVPRDPLSVIRLNQRLPRWAGSANSDGEWFTWTETGHRLILPVYDVQGELRSVRAWRVPGMDAGHEVTPKRLPPSGKRSKGLLLMAPTLAARIRASGWPGSVVVVEGEPDFIAARAALVDGFPVIGWLSGSDYPPAHVGCYVATHADEAGDRYAEGKLVDGARAGGILAACPGSVRMRPPCDLSDMPRDVLGQWLISVG